jgi:DNA-binding CsgD family transcriptional regulator
MGNAGKGSIWERFTKSEQRLVALIGQGLYLSRDIESALARERRLIGRRTIESHISSAMRKAGVSSRMGLAPFVPGYCDKPPENKIVLTRRQAEIIGLYATTRGTSVEMSKTLGCRPRTVENIIGNICVAAGVRDRRKLVPYYRFDAYVVCKKRPCLSPRPRYVFHYPKTRKKPQQREAA